MRCPTCRTENPDEAKYCLRCGFRLALACPRCAAENPQAAKFCSQCGTYLLNKSHASGRPVDGERKLVTVLFADIQGSLTLILGRDPEHGGAILAQTIEAMKQGVHRFEGTVNRVIGDGIMALFGAPIAHEDHAVRACYAALAIRESVAQIGAEIKKTHDVDVQVRIGLNSGEVVVQTVSTDLSEDYDATGETVHLASRMEQLATPGSARFTAATMRLVDGFIRAKSLGPQAIRGVPEPIEVFELIDVEPRKTFLQFGSDRELSPFVDRSAEIRTLEEAAEKACARQGQLVAIIGEPGCGKSRLIYEFVSSRQAENWRILEARALSYATAISYLPVINLLKSYFELDDSDNHDAIRDKIARRLRALGPRLMAELPAFLTLHDTPFDESAWQSLAPAERRQRILEAIRMLFVRESQGEPLMAVFEDLHWIDAETQSCLDRLVEALPQARMLVLVTYRPEYAHGWGGRPFYSQHRIEPFAAGYASDLFQALTGAGADIAPVEQLVVARTQGNPFFLEETVNALIDERILLGDRGAYRLAKPVHSIQVPSTVRALLAARIDRLDPQAKRLLQAAAVIGKDVPFALLAAIAECPVEDLRNILTQLQTAEFLYETRIFPDLEYTFRHALTHEVSFRSMLHKTRRGVHGSILAAIETLYHDRLVEHAERLAHHAAQSEQWHEAAQYARQAGAKAAALSADGDAIIFFEQALAAIDRLPPGDDTTKLAIDIRFDLRTPLFRLGELGRELENLREAERLATALGERTRLALLFLYQSHILWLVGEQDRAIENADRAAALAGDDDPALKVSSTFRRGLSYFALCDFPRTIAAMQETLGKIHAPGMYGQYELDDALGVVCLSYQARSFAETGDFAQGRIVADEAFALATKVDVPFYYVFANLGLGYLLDRRGDHHDAIPWLEQALQLCRNKGALLLVPPAATFLGLAYLDAGKVDRAIPLLEEGVETADQMGFRFQQGLRLAALAEGYLRSGDATQARKQATRAEELSVAQRERGAQAYAARVVASIHALRGARGTATAEKWYRKAAGLAGKLGMRPLVAHCRRDLALLHVEVRPAHAQDELRHALALYRELDMPRLAIAAEQDLAAISAGANK